MTLGSIRLEGESCQHRVVEGFVAERYETIPEVGPSCIIIIGKSIEYAFSVSE